MTDHHESEPVAAAEPRAAAPVDLSDYVRAPSADAGAEPEGAEGSEAQRAPRGEPYRADQLAGALAALTSAGVADAEAYRATVAAQLSGAFEIAELGDALAELGIDQSASADAVPAWLRLGGALAFAGVTVVRCRAEHGRPVSVRPGSPVARAWGWLRSRLPFGKGGAGADAAAARGADRG